MKKVLLISLTLCASFLVPRPDARAEIKTVEAESTYAIGDNDSKVDARRIAIQEAKRKALELAGTYVASLTVVKDYKLSKDEVTAYTAGLVETQVISEEMRGTVDRPEIYVRALCRIDTDVLATQIQRYQENEGLKEQLTAARSENERLQKERDDLVARLAAEKDKARAETTRKQLDTVLAREEANDEINRAWGTALRRIDVSNGMLEPVPIPREEADPLIASLERASAVNPLNPKANILLASLYARSGNPAAAEGTLRKAAALDPRNPFYHMALGRVLRSTGRPEAALGEFRIVERLRPHHPPMLFETGMTHRALGDCRQAVAYLKRFLRVTQTAAAPNLGRLRAEAVKTIDACGRKPEGRPGRHRPPVRR